MQLEEKKKQMWVMWDLSLKLFYNKLLFWTEFYFLKLLLNTMP